MNNSVKNILEKALQMSPEDRAIISLSLINSLDEIIDDDAEIEWQKEIKRRLDDINNNEVDCLEWYSTLKKLKEELI